jgi:hypothetical protein
MESIVSFSFPELNYKCSLNPKGRKRYGNLEQLLDSRPGVPSTVGLPDGSKKELPNVRLSYKYPSTVELNLDPILVTSQLQKLVDENCLTTWKNKQKYDVIEYLPGGFFKEHFDKKIKKNHYGTLLIFPPAVGRLAHTGGELIIDKGKFIFNSSTNTEWTFIAFHTYLPHECKEVLSGTRIVFKTELLMGSPQLSAFPDLNGYDEYPEICDGGIDYLTEKNLIEKYLSETPHYED